uniref:Endonuclease V n=1 Tax=Chrysotila carterae TaxID=13221 RepID=A0A7S4BU46_CHRCT
MLRHLRIHGGFSGFTFLLSAATLSACSALLLNSRRTNRWKEFFRLKCCKARWWIIQRVLRLQVCEYDLCDLEDIELVGGVDLSFIKGSDTDACAALVVLRLPTLEVVYESYKRVELRAPYIPGFLAFREVYCLADLLEDLYANMPELMPDAILVDGNGRLHPNRFGLACHLGVLCGVPTVGVGKSLHYVDGLTRERLRAVADAECATVGAHGMLVGDSGAVWGTVLRTTSPAAGEFKPVVVSVGHGLSLESATALVRACCKHRVPEPIRQADLRSRAWLRRNPTAK